MLKNSKPYVREKLIVRNRKLLARILRINMITRVRIENPTNLFMAITNPVEFEDMPYLREVDLNSSESF